MLGESRNHIFIVEIAATKSVGALKDAIKEKKRPAFDYVPADTLVLWNASVPIKRNLKETIEVLNLVDEDALQPPDILLDVFPSGPQIQLLLLVHKLSEIFSKPLIKEHVHIIVKPPPARSTVKEADLGEKDDIITALKTSSFLPL